MESPHTFSIRKCSKLVQGESWRHFPQRSGLTLHLVVERIGLGIAMIYWKGDSLAKLYWNRKFCLQFSACYPSLSMKQVLLLGDILQRVQVDFKSNRDFEQCRNAIELCGLPYKTLSSRRGDIATTAPSDSEVYPFFQFLQQAEPDYDCTQVTSLAMSQSLEFDSTQNTSLNDFDIRTTLKPLQAEPLPVLPLDAQLLTNKLNDGIDPDISDEAMRNHITHLLKQKSFKQLLAKVERVLEEY